MKALLVLGALAIPAAGLAAGKGKAPAVSFAADIAPLLKTRCAVCHLTGTEAGKLALHPKAARGSLVGRQSTESKLLLIAPGKPQASYMLMKIEGTHISTGKGSGARMPFGQAPLDAAAIDKVRRWIAAGAPDN